ncbi:GTPase HflX [Microvirga brassicacearum]|uniref:GTPase HflX n=1 Tax=Microvirga brassicacearum TaxID=2580413 RepID=A0A5N3P8P9_9HYPH|nr:GTPase HflX [Microvirga brassicacearum]KAB0266112.1 GTPase HflX [Microvirga brassicacearum]
MTEPRTPGEERLLQLAEPEKEVAAGTNTLVVGPYLIRKWRLGGPRQPEGEGANPRPAEARLDEAAGLAAAIDLHIVHTLIAPLSAPRPATYIGSGKVEEIAGLVRAEEIGLVVMDCALSPVQQRNLEKEWGAKVIDRTGLILEIFGRRARTKEGTLQVELAHLSYQKGRLVRSWTHLERQRGGFGFLGGPGETQIEADRRMIQERMTRIERELETVVKTRSLHRKSRRRVPYPIIALVGYTNAGKSTLFNRMTEAEVLAENMLFATLDPTSRAIDLPHGEKAILSDTVGFISDLPTMLVAAFRATLEDVVEADVLLHVRDVSHGESDAQAGDVAVVLRELGIDPDDTKRIVEVWNKADLISPEDRTKLAAKSSRTDEERRPVLISALTGEGIPELLSTIEEHLSKGRVSYQVDVLPEDGQGLAWLHENTEILDRETTEDGHSILRVRVMTGKEPRFLNRFPGAQTL